MHKHVLTVFLVLSIGTVYAAPKINNKEYAQLLQDCQTIASRIKQQHDFEIIRQDALRNQQQIMAGLSAQFGYKNNELHANPIRLQNDLEILRIDHERKVAALMIQAISIYLQSVGTPTAEQLARDLVKASFRNMGLL